MLLYTLKISFSGTSNAFDYAEEIDAIDEPVAILMAQDALQAVGQRLDDAVAILVDEDGDEVGRHCFRSDHAR